jgi:hypothetical protein
VIDFQIVTAVTQLQVQSIAPIRNFLPASIVVLGTNLDRATQVFYNGIQAPEFIPVTQSRLIVRIPTSQIGKKFNGISVLGDSLLATSGTAALSLNIANPLRLVEGLSRLVQAWVMVFLTTPGSDVFNPQSGGGARAIIGRTTDRRGSGVSADLANSIMRTKSELNRVQANNPNIPLSEKLLNSSLEALAFDSNTGSLLAQVSIQNMLGQAAQVSLAGAQT